MSAKCFFQLRQLHHIQVAQVVSIRSKYVRGLTQFQRQTLHWLDVADRILFRLCLQGFKCQHSMAVRYLPEWVANIDGHRHLWSAGRGQLDVNIRRTHVLLCIERSSWLFTVLAQWARLQLMSYINYLLTYIFAISVNNLTPTCSVTRNTSRLFIQRT